METQTTETTESLKPNKRTFQVIGDILKGIWTAFAFIVQTTWNLLHFIISAIINGLANFFAFLFHIFGEYLFFFWWP